VKIIHLIARYNKGGTANWLNTLIPMLRSNGIETEIYAGRVENGELEDENFEILKGKRLEGLSRGSIFLSDLKNIFKFRSILKIEKPDILNTHTAKAGVVGRIAALGLGITLIHTYHGHVYYGYFGKFKVSLYKFVEKQLAKITRLFIVNGEKVGNELVNFKIIPKSKLRVILPGIQIKDFEERESARRRFALGEEVVVGWLARITEIKRIDRVLELAVRFPNIKFLVGGYGSNYESVLKLAPQNVQFVGWQPAKIFWPACDIALLTSDNEAVPISLIEAAAFGLPIIGEDVGSVSEIVINEETGYLVCSFDERVNALTLLSNSEKERERMGEAGKQLAVERYSIKKFIDLHLEAYNFK
jgi:glycosyltransferase involved in cell wall biosynthesis